MASGDGRAPRNASFNSAIAWRNALAKGDGGDFVGDILAAIPSSFSLADCSFMPAIASFSAARSRWPSARSFWAVCMARFAESISSAALPAGP